MSNRSIIAALIAAIAGPAMACASLAAQVEDCGKLAATPLPHASVTHAEVVPAEGAKVPYCRVQATSRPTADSDIRFEVWIPFGDAWNGKFQQVGNGGFAGQIPSRAMAVAVAQGYAVAGTDDGHQSADMTDAAWARGHEEKIRDYGWRAISETTLGAKLLLRTFKGKPADKSYFIGCSDGGREAFMMAQRFPAYFDGIVAGAPAYAMTRLLTGGAARAGVLTSSMGHLSSVKLKLLQTAALKSCGNGASYLKDPRQCRPNLAALRCSNGDTDTCLNDAQLAAAQAFYRDERDPATGDTLYGVLPGAEAVRGGWDAWLAGGDDGSKPAGLGFTWNYLANMVMDDPHLDLVKVTSADIARGEIRYAPMMDASDPDLSKFKAHGGKLIHYHGWNDPGIPPGYSVEYHARVLSIIGAADDFYRLYMVPGMLHCGGGDAPTMVDWHAAIVAWVEKGVAPGNLIAADAAGGTQTLSPFVAGSAAVGLQQ
jgi:Tannase and feruloyl esterase